MSAEIADAARVIAWANTPNRPPANSAFTAGPERQAAYWIEWAQSKLAAAPEGATGNWSIHFQDERDFCRFASILIGAAYTSAAAALQRFADGSLWGEVTHGAVSASAPPPDSAKALPTEPLGGTDDFDAHFRQRIDVYADKHPALLVRQLATRLRAAWATPLPQGTAPLVEIAPDARKGKPPCGECHLKAGETCDICGAKEPAVDRRFSGKFDMGRELAALSMAPSQPPAPKQQGAEPVAVRDGLFWLGEIEKAALYSPHRIAGTWDESLFSMIQRVREKLSAPATQSPAGQEKQP